MRKCYLVVIISLFSIFTSANVFAAYILQASGQSLTNYDQKVVRTYHSDTDGVTALGFDTGYIQGTYGGYARSAASVNLATGKLKIFAESYGDPEVGGGAGLQVASADAAIHEYLSFDLPDGILSSPVTVNFTITGSVSGDINGGVLPQSLQFESERDSISLHDFSSPDRLSVTLSVKEGVSYLLYAGLMGSTGSAGHNIIDLNNTGKLSISMENGVSFNSASGVFLSAVPIPAMLPLFALSVLGLGIAKKSKIRI